MFTLRPYQSLAIEKGIEFFTDPKMKGGAIIVLPTAAGKSLISAGIIQGLAGNTVILQPTKEILEQNYLKLTAYGYKAGIYSASFGKRQIQKITFATIGSIINKKELFQNFHNIIIDECDLVNAKGGMYKEFIEHLSHCKVLGLTATPYRLSSVEGGSMLKFISRTRPKIFSKVVYAVQNKLLFDQGYLAKLRYFDMLAIDRRKLQKNSTGADYTDQSLKLVLEAPEFIDKCAEVVNRLLAKNRRGIIVFTGTTGQSAKMQKRIKGSVTIDGKTDAKTRKQILTDFKNGIIKCLINVGIVVVGFDYPELDTIVVCKPTMSLRWYYQALGRAIRIHPDKEEAWIIDMCENIARFGRIEDLKLRYNNGLWAVNSNGRQLTNVPFS